MLLSLLLVACGPPAPPDARASAGVLDLGGSAPLAEPVALDGAWELVPGELLEPGDFPELGAHSVEVPGAWNELQGGPGVGSGTYRLRLRLPPGSEGLGLRVPPVHTAQRTWLDGRPISESGRVGSSPELSWGRMGSAVVPLPDGEEELELVVQVSNFAHRKGGLRRSWSIGDYDTLLRQDSLGLLSSAARMGFLVLVGLQYLMLWSFQRREPARLWFGLLALIAGVRTALEDSAPVVGLLFPSVGSEVLLCVEYATAFGALSTTVLFYRHLFPEDATKGPVERGFAPVAGALGLLCLLLPSLWVTELLPLLAVVLGLCMALSLRILVRATLAGRPVARLTVLACLAVALGAGHDALVAFGVIHTGASLASTGFLVLVGAQAVGLSKHFADAYRRVQALSNRLRVSNEELERTNDAVVRFVPFEFLDLLDKRSIRQVQRGDSVALELEVVFCDIRGFTPLMEGLRPEEAFPFINDYLQHMEPAVYDQGGFILEYLGDCIVSAFPGGADAAVQGCLQMFAALDRFNATQPPERRLRVGMGLHSGPAMLGTIGGRDRLSANAVGDVMNSASRVEGMTKMYGTNLLFTDATLARLEHPERLSLREVDRVLAKGKARPMSLYEVLDALPTELRALREATLEDFGVAMAAFRAGQIGVAREAFWRCAQRSPEDPIPPLYLSRCQRLEEEGLPDGWDGTRRLDVK